MVWQFIKSQLSEDQNGRQWYIQYIIAYKDFVAITL